MNNPKLTQPTTHLMSGRAYVPASATNVRETWLLFGWQPPSRERQQVEMQRLNPLPRVEAAQA